MRSMHACKGLERRVMLAAVAALGLGCGPTILLEDDSGSSGDDTTTSTGSPPSTTLPGTTAPPPPPGTTTTPPPPPEETTVGPEDTGVVFIFEPDGGGPGGYPCDMFAQDCPPGEKCMPWASDGGNSWNDTRCSPVVDDPDAVGEPCVVFGSGVSGLDTCELGAMCWDVDPDTLEGTCVAFCMGDESNPYCEDENASCQISSDSVLILCLPNCDPILQDCADGEACYWEGDAFMCLPDASEGMGAVADPCEFLNVCDPGLFCANHDDVPGCLGMVGCCSPFCELGDATPPCLPGQECVPWYEEGTAPTGQEHIGACVVPR